MSKNTRVAGHELKYEGAAFTNLGSHYARARVNGTGGFGVALCSCGATSPMLTSGNLRKAWHRNHKADAA